MTDLRKIVLMCVASVGLVAVVPAFAEPAADGAKPEGQKTEKRAERRMPIQEAMEKLDLTPEQKAKIEPILEDAREKMREALKNNDRDAAREVMQSVREQVEPILTPEQKMKFAQALRERMGGGPGGATAAGGPGMMLERARGIVAELNLTDEQKTNVADLFKTYEAKFAELRKSAGEDRQAKMQQAKPLLDEFKGQLTALLTPEQAQTLQEKISAGRPGRDAGQKPDQPKREKNGEARPDKEKAKPEAN